MVIKKPWKTLLNQLHSFKLELLTAWTSIKGEQAAQRKRWRSSFNAGKIDNRVFKTFRAVLLIFKVCQVWCWRRIRKCSSLCSGGLEGITLREKGCSYTLRTLNSLVCISEHHKNMIVCWDVVCKTPQLDLS